MPGLSHTSAHVIVAEIGIDMSRFATPGHLLSWAAHFGRADAAKTANRLIRRLQQIRYEVHAVPT